MLVVPERSLGVFYTLDVPNIHPGRSISFFKALADWEMPNLLCVSGVSSKESNRRLVVPEMNLGGL